MPVRCFLLESRFKGKPEECTLPLQEHHSTWLTTCMGHSNLRAFLQPSNFKTLEFLHHRTTTARG